MSCLHYPDYVNFCKEKCAYADTFSKICYTVTGKETRESLWEETLEEIKFAGAAKIVEEFEKSLSVM